MKEEEQDTPRNREIRQLTKEDIEEILKELDEEFPVPKTAIIDTEWADNYMERLSPAPKLLDTRERFEFVLKNISPEIRLKRSFEKGIHDAQRYYEHGLKEEPPSLIMEIEERLTFFLYEAFHNERPRGPSTNCDFKFHNPFIYWDNCSWSDCGNIRGYLYSTPP